VIEQLAAAYRHLHTDGERVDVKSEAGYAACAAFLVSIDAAARSMGLEAASRQYRVTFSANYQALFPDSARHYRVDVLEASADQDPAIWVNGDKFEFSAEATSHAQRLQQAWTALGMQLERWNHAAEASAPEVRPLRHALVTSLTALDQAWADFEHQYITELIDIEAKARRLIVQAVEQERKLQLLELSLKPNGSCRRLVEVPEYRQEQKRLVSCIARLNSVANINRKGRDDLGAEILESAGEVLRRCDAGELGNGGSGGSGGSGGASSGHPGDACNAARVLAQDIVGSFAAMRSYLQKVGRCLERVDPHLCNNNGLVTRLVDWEESWEVGARYVLQPPMLDAVCDLVAEVKAAQQLAPALASMCEDCDVELFLVLPRIIMLCFVADPIAKRRGLLLSLLPHRFSTEADGLCPELAGFVEEFKTVKQALAGLLTAGGAVVAHSAGAVELTRAWELLVRRAVAGATEDKVVYGFFAPEARDPARSAVESLMRGLEFWSLDLQRHCPEDWNQFSAVLVECLSGGSQKQQRSHGFQV